MKVKTIKKQLKKISFVALLLLTSGLIFAQNESSNVKKNGIDADFFGVSGYGSINYDRLLIHPQIFSVGLRVGVGAYRFKDYLLNFNPDFIFYQFTAL